MKRQYNLIALVVIAIVSSLSTVKAQSPWVFDKGHGYSHIAVGVLPSYDEVFQGSFDDRALLEGTQSELSIQSYTEIGLGKGFGAVLSLPINIINSELEELTPNGRTAGSLSGFGLTELSLKYNIASSSLQVTSQLGVTLPLGSTDEATGLRTSYEATILTPMISVGKGFGKSYAYGYLGHEFNLDGYNDNLRFGLEYGYKFFGKLWTIAAFNMEEPTTKRTLELDPRIEETRLYVNDQYYNSLAIKLIYEISEKIGINASANLISTRANNLPFQAPLSLGVYLRW